VHWKVWVKTARECGGFEKQFYEERNMKILVLNGNPHSGNGTFDDYLDRLVEGMKSDGHEADLMRLRDMKIKPCVGCFNCWVKTPGICATGTSFTL